MPHEKNITKQTLRFEERHCVPYDHAAVALHVQLVRLVIMAIVVLPQFSKITPQRDTVRATSPRSGNWETVLHREDTTKQLFANYKYIKLTTHKSPPHGQPTLQGFVNMLNYAVRCERNQEQLTDISFAKWD